jgi:hypothetical protein
VQAEQTDRTTEFLTLMSSTHRDKGDGMPEGRRRIQVPKEHPTMGRIVGYFINNYPFFRVIVVCLVLFYFSPLLFDIERHKEFGLLIYAAVVLLPPIKSLIEFRKMQFQPGKSTTPVPSAVSLQQPSIADSLPFSYKAWISVGINLLTFGGIEAAGETGHYYPEFAYVVLVIGLIAAGLALAAMSDIYGQRMRGKRTAIIGIVLSILLFVQDLDLMVELHSVQSGAPVP